MKEKVAQERHTEYPFHVLGFGRNVDDRHHEHYLCCVEVKLPQADPAKQSDSRTVIQIATHWKASVSQPKSAQSLSADMTKQMLQYGDFQRTL